MDGVNDSDKTKTTPRHFYRYGTFVGFFGLCPMPLMFPLLFLLQGYALLVVVCSRSVGGTTAGCFAALNLAYYPNGCYTEVRRTQDEHISAWSPCMKYSIGNHCNN